MSDSPDGDSGLAALSILALKQRTTTSPQSFRLHAQVDQKAERTTAKGTLFLEITLADATDQLIWRVFDNHPAFDSARDLPVGACLELTADWVDTGKFGIEPRSARFRPLTDEERNQLFAGDAETAARQRHDQEDLGTLLVSISDPRLRTLCLLFMERYGERFNRTAAARGNHHARRGGLVEHVAQMMRSASALCSAYPDLNRDLLLAGVLFHDCGKLWENSYPETGFSQSQNLGGELLSHIPLGMEVVNQLWRELMGTEEAAGWSELQPASDAVRLHLLHLIGSHHGTHEFGSPVLPKTPEAVALHHIDNIDAKLEMLKQGYSTSREVAPGIHERFRPWPTRVVTPLPPFRNDPPA